jgi:Fe-S-cluster containining protein
MPLPNLLAILNRLYGLYDQFTASLEVACKKYCCACCTCNVTLTTLEGYKILSSLDSDRITQMLEPIEKQLGKPRFIPEITTNRLAELCMSEKEPPEEENDVNWGACPLLEDDTCSIYAVRPFACRCLVSKQNCRDTGVAEVDEFTMTVNNLFLQVIEHIDQNGLSGNLLDVLVSLTAGDGAEEKPSTPSTLIANSPIHTLLIPPEHLDRIKPILHAIRSISI